MTNSTEYDIIVLGAGPGGYPAAIRAAQLGMRVACVDPRQSLGGTCLNVGCIPSKALLTSTAKFYDAREHFVLHGIRAEKLDFDLTAMMAHKDRVVRDNAAGIEFLFRREKVDWIRGAGKIISPTQVEATLSGKPVATINGKAILIATGSVSAELSGVNVDGKCIVTSTEALAFDAVPKRMTVIGGGAIGLELGSVWSRLGAEVTVIEFRDRLLPGMDSDIAAGMLKVLSKQGIKFHLSTKVKQATVVGSTVTLSLEAVSDGGTTAIVQTDKTLVAVGRRPFSSGLGLEELGVVTDQRGAIEVDGRFATNIPGIYAVGDVIRGPMLAHKAEEEGVICVEMLAGQSGHINYDAIPSVVYTAPEAASVGRTEEQLQASGIEYRVGKFPFSANGRARAMAETNGFVKIIADARTDKVLGAHILGAEAGTLIAEMALAIEFAASAEDVARTCHAHPTLNEAVKEAALAVAGRAIHV